MNPILTKSYPSSVVKLKEWRTRYSKKEYPEKVLINLYYNLHTTNYMWDEIVRIFLAREKVFGDVVEALNSLEDRYREVQVQKINQRLLDLIRTSPIVGGLNYNNYSADILKAQNGDNAAVEEVEYSYLFYSCIDTYILLWAAFGLTGEDQEKAYIDSTGMLMHGLPCTEYEKAISVFIPPTSQFFGGNDGIGGIYEPLEPLW